MTRLCSLAIVVIVSTTVACGTVVRSGDGGPATTEVPRWLQLDADLHEVMLAVVAQLPGGGEAVEQKSNLGTGLGDDTRDLVRCDDEDKRRVERSIVVTYPRDVDLEVAISKAKAYLLSEGYHIDVERDRNIMTSRDGLEVSVGTFPGSVGISGITTCFADPS